MASDPSGGVGALRSVGSHLLRQPRGLAWLAPVLWMAVLWWSSSRPAGVDLGRGMALSFGWNLAHAPAFGLLALLLVPLAPRDSGWARLGPRELAWILALSVGYGAIDEWHQAHVPGRHSSPLDVATDAVGVGCVLWISAYLGREDAREGTLRRRLALCLGLCLAAAGVATFLSGSG